MNVIHLCLVTNYLLMLLLVFGAEAKLLISTTGANAAS